MKRIGIVGGTFDPIHFGHLMLGRQAFKEYHLDEVWYMPSRQPPHKKGHSVTSSRERLEMVELAISETPYFILSEFELKRINGNTYTADTLRLLKEEYQDTEFFFIVGADSVFDIEKWYQPGEVLKLATFLTADRECENRDRTLEEQILYLGEKYGARILKLHSQELNISSEHLRKMVSEHISITGLVPEAVEQYILKHKLYQCKETHV